jgi:uncharacterized protein
MGHEKSQWNLHKHEVAFEEAVRAFEDDFSATFPDPEHSLGESRLITYGMSNKSRLLVISHTERGDTIRIISAREATKAERKRYEA